MGQKDEAGALQSLLKRVMEIDAEITNTVPPTEYNHNTQKCRAYCTAEEYDLPKLEELLKQSTAYQSMPSITPDALHLAVVPERGGGEVFVFSNGTFVAWGVQQSQTDEFFRDCVRGLQSGVELRPIRIETENMEYTVDEDEMTDMKGDMILLNPHIPSPTLAKVAFSYGLARSTKLSALESLMEEHLSAMKRIPMLLMDDRPITMGRREIKMKLGELLHFRQQWVSWEGSLDEADFYWARPELKDCYNKVLRNTDVRPRIAVLNRKLRM
ncbi:hypothetical protein DFQ30_000384 [Apophysomyces sp. BC1015]|nr:hypothetical protein DFQ30_000384 [Apophysomyces sp. BC1015]